MLSHANLAANTQSIVEYLRLGNDDCIVTVLPFYYSYGNSVLHTHLACGARLILEPNLVYPHKIVETMARERVGICRRAIHLRAAHDAGQASGIRSRRIALRHPGRRSMAPAMVNRVPRRCRRRSCT